MLDLTPCAPPEQARPVHAPSRAALNLPGLCPLCGHDAVRKICARAGIQTEVYRCPVDGEVSYGTAGARMGFDGKAATVARLVGLHEPSASMPMHLVAARAPVGVGA